MTTEHAGVRKRRDGSARREKTILTDRDREILYFLGMAGIARTRDLSRAFFGARGTACDRLRKLYVAGFIICFAPDLAGDNYYALTALGRDQVVEAFEVDPARVRVVRKLPKKLEHALAITEVRLSIAIACRGSNRYELDSFQTDADLAAERHATLLDLIPDARVVVRTKGTGQTHAFFLEVDLGTEAVTWLVRHKLAVYARHAAIGTALYGVRDPLIILVVESLRRARNVARALDAARVSARVVFAIRSQLDEENVFGAAYASPADLVSAPVTAATSTLFARRLLS